MTGKVQFQKKGAEQRMYVSVLPEKALTAQPARSRAASVLTNPGRAPGFLFGARVVSL